MCLQILPVLDCGVRHPHFGTRRNDDDVTCVTGGYFSCQRGVSTTGFWAFDRGRLVRKRGLR